MGGGKGGKTAAEADPRLLAQQLASMQTSDEATRFMMAQAKEMLPIQKAQMQFGLDTARTAYDQSQQDRTFQLGRRDKMTSAQDAFSDKVAAHSTKQREDGFASEAIADVNQAAAGAKAQGMRMAGRYGNPSDGRMAAMDNQQALGHAALVSNASNKARTAARAEGLLLDGQVANMFKGSDINASTLSGSGAGYGGMGLSYANSAGAGMGAGFAGAGGMANQTGAGATNMWTAQGNYKNAFDQANKGSDVFGDLAGMAVGAYTGNFFGSMGKRQGST